MNQDLEEARKVLDDLAPQMNKSGEGNFVVPAFVGSYQLVLDYARLRLLLAALDMGAPQGVVTALATPSATPSPTAPAPGPNPVLNGGLVIPGRG